MKLRTATALLLATAAVAVAQTSQPTTRPVAPADLVTTVKPSLVVVRFTYDGELGRRELDAMGVVVREDGLTIVPSEFTPRQVPDEQMKDFKIVVPGDEETEIDADLVGRDEPYNVTFVLPKKPGKFTPIKFAGGDLHVGDTVHSIGLLPKDAGNGPYLYSAHVAALLRGPVPQVLVDGSGLTVTGSVVFDAFGQAVGMVNAQNDRVLVLGNRVLPLNDRGLMLNDSENPNASVENPTRVFIPAADFLPALAIPPTLDKPVQVPFLGVVQLTGLTKDVAEYYGLKGKVAVQVGDTIPGFSAAKAGLKKGDVIVSLNGKPLERGDEPEEAPLIFTRKISQMNVGQKITLGIVTGPDTPAKPLDVTLDARPALSNTMKRFYAEDLGFTARNPAFEDTYGRKLDAGTKGLVVAFVRPQSSAQSAGLQDGDFVKQLNQTPVTDVAQFKKDYEEFRKDKPKEAVVVEVLRGGNTQIIRIEPPRE